MSYVGNKERIASAIVPYINSIIKLEGIETYIEPFLGSGAIAKRVKCKKRIGSDYNKYLIDFYDYLRAGNKLPETTERDEYNDIRASYKDGSYPGWYVFLMGCVSSFRSKWFGGYIQYGTRGRGADANVNYYKQHCNFWYRTINELEGVDISYNSYDVYRDVKNCFIYCDPPYRDTIGYANDFDSNAFDNWVREVAKNNIVLISEYSMPEDFVCVNSVKLQNGFSNSTSTERVYMYKHGMGIEYFDNKDVI